MALTVLTIPVSPGRNVDMKVPAPMLPEEWNVLCKVLDAMRPALVEES